MGSREIIDKIYCIFEILRKLKEKFNLLEGRVENLEKILPDGGNHVIVEDVLTSTSKDNALSANQGRNLNSKLATKVEAVTGKGLSQNDFTNSQKDALDDLIANKASTTTEINNIKNTIQNLTVNGGKTPVEDVLVSTSATNALSANQGRVLKNLIDNIQHTEVVDDFNNPDSTKALSSRQGTNLLSLIRRKIFPYTLADVTKSIPNIFKLSNDNIYVSVAPTLLLSANSSVVDENKILSGMLTVLNFPPDENTPHIWYGFITTPEGIYSGQLESDSPINVITNTWQKVPYPTGTNSGSSPIDIINALTSTATNKALSANQGKILKDLLDAGLNRVTNDISANRTEINILKSQTGGTTTPIEDNLISDLATSALSAKQGKVLKGLIDNKKEFTDADKQDVADLKASQTTINNNIQNLQNTVTNLPAPIEIVDDLVTDDSTKALSAKQGKILEDKKLDKVQGKQLSTEDFTTAEKNKLASLVQNTGGGGNANVSVVDDLVTTSPTDALSANQGKILNDIKVDKVSGKDLSTNDFTDADKLKLDGISSTQIIDDLASDRIDAALSAKQGKELKALIDTKVTSEAGKGLSDTNYTQAEKDKLATLSPTAQVTVTDNLTTDSATEALSARQGKNLQDNKVDKVAGKVLSDNNFTTVEKDKLTALQNTVVENVLTSVSTTNALSAAQGKALKDTLDTKVDKVQGKGLSDTNFSQAEKTKLAGLQNTTVVNTLVGTSTTNALSANQGRLLNEKFDTKVDKVQGKQLSTEDYTTTEKTKLASLSNIEVVNNLTSVDTDKALSAAQGKVLEDTKVDKIAGKVLSTEDFTTPLKTKLENLVSSTLIPRWDKFIGSADGATFPIEVSADFKYDKQGGTDDPFNTPLNFVFGDPKAEPGIAPVVDKDAPYNEKYSTLALLQTKRLDLSGYINGNIYLSGKYYNYQQIMIDFRENTYGVYMRFCTEGNINNPNNSQLAESFIFTPWKKVLMEGDVTAGSNINVVDNLISTVRTDALSANQGRELRDTTPRLFVNNTNMVINVPGAKVGDIQYGKGTNGNETLTFTLRCDLIEADGIQRYIGQATYNNNGVITTYVGRISSGNQINFNNYLEWKVIPRINDGLDSLSQTDALSAGQGRILKSMVDIKADALITPKIWKQTSGDTLLQIPEMKVGDILLINSNETTGYYNGYLVFLGDANVSNLNSWLGFVTLNNSYVFKGLIFSGESFQTETSTWKTEIDLNDQTGIIIASLANNIPAGYIRCNGGSYNISTYRRLYDTLNQISPKPSWFTSNGQQFTVPDLRGRFLRGVGGNAAALGAYQEDAVQEHQHSYILNGGNNASLNPRIGGVEYFGGAKFGGTDYVASNGDNGFFYNTYRNTGRTASETHPVNMSVNYYMKY